MKQEKKILMVAALSLFCTVGCDRKPQAKQRRIEAENTQRWESAVHDLAKKHNAVSDWAAKLRERGDYAQLFSIEVSRALIQSNGQPVLLLMRLSDIVEKGGSYSAVFIQDYFENLYLNLNVELKCSEDQAKQLVPSGKRNPLGLFTEYAVVARIEQVSRPRFEVRGTVEGGDEFGATTGVELDSSSDTFFAKGTCVEVLRKDESESVK